MLKLLKIIQLIYAEEDNEKKNKRAFRKKLKIIK